MAKRKIGRFKFVEPKKLKACALGINWLLHEGRRLPNLEALESILCLYWPIEKPQEKGRRR